MRAKDYTTRISGTVRKKPRKSEEHDEQVKVFKYVSAMIPFDSRYDMIYAIPNGGYRHKTEGARLRAAGVKSGIPDIAVDVPSGSYHGLRIEMKAGKNKTTPAQAYMLEMYARHGYKTAVCYGAKEAIDEIENYMRLS